VPKNGRRYTHQELTRLRASREPARRSPRITDPRPARPWSGPDVKLSVMQENLARGLGVVSRAVSNRSTLPVLANVLLRTEDGGLRLTTTNLEIGLGYWSPDKVETAGATPVPARLLAALVSSLPGGQRIDLETGPGETLHVS